MAIPLLDTRSLSDDVRAALRLRAVAAREAGFANDTVAAILGLRPESVSRWFAAYQRGGLEALPGDRGKGGDSVGRRDGSAVGSDPIPGLRTPERTAGANGLGTPLPCEHDFDHYQRR